MVSFCTSVYILSSGVTHRWHLENSPSFITYLLGVPGVLDLELEVRKEREYAVV